MAGEELSLFHMLERTTGDHVFSEPRRRESSAVVQQRWRALIPQDLQGNA